MTPLQKAVQAVIEDHCDKSPYFDDAMAGLRKALEAEQEKAVEPHGWMIDGSSEVMSRGHAQAVQTEHQAMGGTAVAYPIYTHPAPPASDHVPETAFGNTERAELIARLIRKADAWDYLQPGAKRLNACRQAADMLKADADLRAQLARRTVERDMAISMAAGVDAQQVAVPLTDEQIESVCRFIEPSLDGPIAYDLLIARAIEARHGIKAKPSHTDWSAA